MSFIPPPALVARFRDDMAALGAPRGMIGIAVSGGPDSLALLLLAAAAFPGRVRAATVDHRLRPESMLEALHVEDICARLACSHAILAVDVPDGPGGVQAEARDARYAALSAWAARQGVGEIATAHHADDQAETLLMRLRRGAGVGGLAGVRPVRDICHIRLLRPLLGWTKADLVHIVASAGVEPVDDPSNRDPRFDRTGVRALLAGGEGFDARALARSAAAAREADDALAWAADRLWRERVRQSGDAVEFDHRGLPAELKRRLITAILALFRPDPPRGDAIGRLIADLDNGRSATLAGAKCEPREAWRFTPAPPRRTG